MIQTWGSSVFLTPTTLVGVSKTDGDYSIYRSFLPFVTSPLPDDATITSASLNVFAHAKKNGDNDNDDYLTVVQTSQTNTNIVTKNDYDQAGAIDNPTEGIDVSERKDLSGIPVGAYTSFQLNSTGLGWISTTDVTKLGLREGHDTIDSAITPTPPIAPQVYDQLTIRTSEYPGTSFDPYLTVTYTQTTESTTTSTTNELTYAYDHGMHRVSKSSDEDTTYYPSSDYSTSDGTSTVYVSSSSGLVASIENDGTTSTTETIHTDHLGSTSVVSDEEGIMVELLDYNPYGTERISWSSTSGDGESEAAKTYIGEYSDDETGLSYLNARYYDPERGQFLSQDTVYLGMGDDSKKDSRLVIALLDPQSQNSYSYARNNPIQFSDSSGNSWFTEAVNNTAKGFESIFNTITFGGGDRIDSMVQDGVTLGKVAGVVAGVVAGTGITAGTAVVIGATAGTAYLAGAATTVATSVTRTGIAVGTSFGKLGTVIASQAGKITGFKDHALQRMSERGISTQTVYNTVTNPLVTLKQAGGTILYLTKEAGVAINKFGQVVTTYSSNEFKAEVQAVIDAALK